MDNPEQDTAETSPAAWAADYLRWAAAQPELIAGLAGTYRQVRADGYTVGEATDILTQALAEYSGLAVCMIAAAAVAAIAEQDGNRPRP